MPDWVIKQLYDACLDYSQNYCPEVLWLTWYTIAQGLPKLLPRGVVDDLIHYCPRPSKTIALRCCGWPDTLLPKAFQNYCPEVLWMTWYTIAQGLPKLLPRGVVDDLIHYCPRPSKTIAPRCCGWPDTLLPKAFQNYCPEVLWMTWYTIAQGLPKLLPRGVVDDLIHYCPRPSKTIAPRCCGWPDTLLPKAFQNYCPEVLWMTWYTIAQGLPKLLPWGVVDDLIHYCPRPSKTTALRCCGWPDTLLPEAEVLWTTWYTIARGQRRTTWYTNARGLRPPAIVYQVIHNTWGQ